MPTPATPKVITAGSIVLAFSDTVNPRAMKASSAAVIVVLAVTTEAVARSGSTPAR